MRAEVPTRNTELLEAIASNTATMVGQLDMLIRITVGQTPKSKVKARLDAFDNARKDAEAAAVQQANEENDGALD
jgi:hypothetical protein